MGRIKTLVKQHPTITFFVVFAVVYPIAKILGLPEISIKINLDVIQFIANFVVIVCAVNWVFKNHPEWIERLEAFVWKVLKLDKYFGEPEDEEDDQDTDEVKAKVMFVRKS